MRRHAKELKPLTWKEVLALQDGTHWVSPLLYVHVKGEPKVRRWVCRYSRPNGRGPTELRLGVAGKVTLKEARDEVRKIQLALTRKEDPQAEQRQRNAQATFGQMVVAYCEDTARRFRNPKSALAEAHLLSAHAGELSNKPVDSIGSQHIALALKSTWTKSPAQAQRAMAAILRALSWAKAHGHKVGSVAELREDMTQIKKAKGRQPVEHFQAMPYKDLPSFMAQLRSRQNDSLSANVIEFLILTAARAGEVCNIRFSEIDWDERVWTVPAKRTKTGREHRVPLSDRALALLNQRRSLARGESVWPSRDNKGSINVKSIYLYLTRTMQIPVTIHGFRSTFRDWAGDIGDVDQQHAELCLAHRPGGVEGAYRRMDALEKRRVILQKWADYCAGKLPASSSG